MMTPERFRTLDGTSEGSYTVSITLVGQLDASHYSEKIERITENGEPSY
jgi:hypothetical protein